MTDTIAATASGARPSADLPYSGVIGVATGFYDLTNELTEANDTLKLTKLPKGHVPVDVVLSTDDIDTGAAMVMDVVIFDESNIPLINGTDVGRVGGIARLDQFAALETTASDVDRYIGVIATTPPGTDKAGRIRVSLTYRAAGRDD